MHTILGAGGPISNSLAAELAKAGLSTRLASRRAINTQPNQTWLKTDLLNHAEVLKAAQGSEVIYLCAGLVYNKNIWRKQWPIVMQNVINASKESGARLIFFDNVYMYGKLEGPMLETSPYNPCSIKGEVRARVATMLMDEVKMGNLNATIARAADFYGATSSINSFFDMMVLEKYSRKKKAMWLGTSDTLHSFSYVPDAGKAMFLLGQSPESDNQIWHIPTAKAISGNEFLSLAAEVFNTEPGFTKINKLMLRTLGLFNQAIVDSVEMYYQYDRNYQFNSSKFEKAFSFNPTSYRKGIEELYKGFYKAIE